MIPLPCHWLSAGPGWSGSVSDHFDGRVFSNPGTTGDSKSFRDLLRWKIRGDRARWPSALTNEATPDFPPRPGPQEAVVTFVNHATFLLQLPGLNILTDPVWSERVSPVSWLGPRRVRPPGIAWESLPHIDAVLLSHNRYDHWDIPTLRRLHDRFQPRFVSGLGNTAFLREIGIPDGEELDWWQRSRTVTGADITFTPARHWSNRGGGNRNTTLWGAFSLRHGAHHLYFGGDTGWHTHFSETRRRLGAPTLALLPIGAYEPRWFMAAMHMNPAEAVEAHLALGAARTLGMHYGTWQLTDEAIDAPPNDLAAARLAHGLPDDVISAARHGETVGLSH